MSWRRFSISSARTRRLVAFVALTVAAVAAVVAPRAAGAQQSGQDAIPGVTISGATVSGPGIKTPRIQNGNVANDFMLSWFADSVVGHPAQDAPPANLPVSHVTIAFTFQQSSRTMVVYYATDGTTAWVGMPPQELGFGSVTKLAWVNEPKSLAFSRQLKSPGLPTSPSSKAAKSGGGFAWSTVVVLVAVALVGALAAFGVARARRGRRDATVS